MTTMIVEPPAYDSDQWRPEYPEPSLYRGSRFSFASFLTVVQVEPERGWVTILNKRTVAFNVQAEPSAVDPNHPLYFEVSGIRYHYAFNVWADRVIIEVCDIDSFDVLAAMYPSEWGELARALASIEADL